MGLYQILPSYNLAKHQSPIGNRLKHFPSSNTEKYDWIRNCRDCIIDKIKKRKTTHNNIKYIQKKYNKKEESPMMLSDRKYK